MRFSILRVIVVLFLLYGWIIPSASAVDCAVSPGGNATISSACTFPYTVDGIDTGTGSSNTALLLVNGGTLTVLGTQTIAVGSLSLGGGSVAIIDGGSMKIGTPLWMTDADSDCSAGSTTQVAQSSAPTNGRRRNLICSLSLADCRDSDAANTTCAPLSFDQTLGLYNRIKSVTSPNLETHYQELPTDINTWALWHMNDGSSNATDSSGSSRTGTLTNGPTWNSAANSKLGASSVAFDGSNDYITVTSADSKAFSKGFTTEGWFKNNASNYATKHIVLIAKANTTANEVFVIQSVPDAGYGLRAYVYADASTYIGAYGGGTAARDKLYDGSWHHVAAVWDGGTTFSSLHIYLDGQELGPMTSNSGGTFTTILDNAQPITIGGGYYIPNANFNAFSGSIDEVRISNIARTPEEIRMDALRRPYGIWTSASTDLTLTPTSWTNLTVGIAGNQTGSGETPLSTSSLVAQWNFNETSGTNANNDAEGTSCGGTPANCDGTLTNFASTASQDQAAGTGWTSNNRRWGAGALNFDGTNDTVLVGSESSFDFERTSAFSINAWIKTTTTSAAEIFSKLDNSSAGPGYELNITNGKLCVILNNNWSTNTIYVCASKTVNDGQTHFVTFTYDGSSTLTGTKFYIDGKFITKDAATYNSLSSTMLNNVSPYIGSKNNQAYYFPGIIDAVSVYSRELSITEILSNYQAGNIEFQTRTSADNSTWEAWKPVTGETQIASMDSDAANWSADTTNPTSGGITKSNDSTTKIEGTGSLKTQIGAPQVDANTVGLWHLDETSGTGAYIKDSTANANHGTPTGTTVVDGFYGKGRSFNGTSDYVDLGDTSSLNITGNALTVSLWAYLTSSPDGAYIWSKTNAPGSGWNLQTKSSNALRFVVNSGTIYCDTGTSAFALNTWNHFVAVYNGATQTQSMYINGTSVTCTQTGTVPTTLASTSGLPLELGRGRYNSGAYGYATGRFDELKVDSAVRSADEIAEAYRAGRDHRLSKTISSTDLSAKTKLPFYVASDRPGTFLEATVGESAYANYEPDANTVGLWHLEEKSTGAAAVTRKDSSGIGNDLTDTNTVPSVQGKIGQAAQFNHSNLEYLTINDNASLSMPAIFTISAWVNPTSFLGLNEPVFCKGPLTAGSYEYCLYYELGTNRLRFLTSNNGTNAYTTDAATAFVAGNWYHVTVKLNSTYQYIYINGVLEGTTATSTAMYDGAGAFQIGARSTGATDRNWNGLIDEVYVTKRAVSDDEIRQQYEIGRRTHPITIDFVTSPQAAYASGTSVTINNPYGTTALTNTLSVGDTIIFKENVGGTETVSQATVTSVTNTSTTYGTVVVASAPTFPSGGFSTNAKVFKWQREMFDFTGSLTTQRDAVTRITLRVSDGSQGANVWLDDIQSASYINKVAVDTVNTSTGVGTYIIAGSNITSTKNRYLQLRAILSSTDPATSAQLMSGSIEYQ